MNKVRVSYGIWASHTGEYTPTLMSHTRRIWKKQITNSHIIKTISYFKLEHCHASNIYKTCYMHHNKNKEKSNKIEILIKTWSLIVSTNSTLFRNIHYWWRKVHNSKVSKTFHLSIGWPCQMKHSQLRNQNLKMWHIISKCDVDIIEWASLFFIA